MRSPALLALLLALPLLAGSVAADFSSLGAQPPSPSANASGSPSTSSQDEELQRPLDQILNLYARDGYVYYKALKSDRAKLDRYLASLAAAGGSDAWSRQRQIAFWLNAYNGFILQSVINNYPIRGHASATGG